MDTAKKYVAVLVHADVWGAQNANALVKAVHDQGAIPILIVTRSTPGKDGKPLTKLDALKLPRVLKEQTMLEYFEAIDALPASGDSLTFNALAKRYCGRNSAYYTTSGGKAGGQQILEIFRELERDGKKPEVVLSGDTLALLPAEITDNYDCFGAHPGPLPEIKGMQGTARSLINRVLYNKHGNRLPANYILGEGDAHVKGSFFNLVTNLDEGAVIETTMTPAMSGMCLLWVRSDLYYALMEKMIRALPELLNKGERKAMIAEAKSAAKPEKYTEIPDLEDAALRHWLGDGGVFVFAEEKEVAHIAQNKIIEPSHFYNLVSAYYPGGDKAAGYKKIFGRLFSPGLAELEKMADEYKSFDLRHMEALRDVQSGKAKMKVKHGIGRNPDGSTYPMTHRTFSYPKKER